MSPVVPVPPSPARAWWDQRSAVAKVLVVLVGAIVAVNAVVALVNLVAGGQQPGGPSSSAYSTGSQGFAAWSSCSPDGVTGSVKVRGPLPTLACLRARTLVIADPDRSAPTRPGVVSSVLAGGGRVVLLGGEAMPSARSPAGRSCGSRAAPRWHVCWHRAPDCGPGARRGAGNGHLEDRATCSPCWAPGPPTCWRR